MNLPLDYQQPKVCSDHHQPIVLANVDGFFCVACLQQMPGNMSIEQFNQQQQKIIEYVTKQIDQDHQSFQELFDLLLKFKEIILQSLDKMAQQILIQIKFIKESEQKLDAIRQSQCSYKVMIKQLQLVSKKQQQFNKDAKDELRKQLQDFQQQYATIDKLYPFLEDRQLLEQKAIGQKNNKIVIKEVQVENEKQLQKFQYELIKESTVKQEKWCWSFAFNKNNTILLIGQGKEIIVYEFMNGRISQQFQSLKIHTDNVYCLYFMKQSKSFVSGSSDKSIIIWILNKNNKWFAQWQLKGHDNTVNCILMNKIENELISGSSDCTLKFWRKNNGSWAFSQKISTKFKAYNASLNEMEDKLIVCENNYKYEQKPKKMSCIQILMLQSNQLWSLVQTIDVPELGWRLSFTIGDQFLFATTNFSFIYIYDYDTNKRQFEKVSWVQIQNIKQCDSDFSCQFIKPLNILTYKHGQFLNIIKMNEKNNYELMQIIDFGNEWISGVMTDDGQYLISRAFQSREIQIRKIISE